MKQIISKKFTNDLEKVFNEDLKVQDTLIDGLYDKYKKHRLSKDNKYQLDLIYKYYLHGLCIDMVEFPLIKFNEIYETLLFEADTGSKDFNIHRGEYVNFIQKKCDLMGIKVDVQSFPVSIIKVAYKFDHPLVGENMINELGIICDSLLVILKYYCEEMTYYHQFLFICRFIKTIDELAEEDYDTLGEESYLYDTLMNLYWLMNAVYSNMLLDSKDYLDTKIVKENSYEN